MRFEKLLTQALHDVPLGEIDAGLEHTILRASAQAASRRKRSRIPFRHFLCKQVYYIGWKLWAVQGLFLLLFDRMLIQLYGERFWDSPSSVARLLFCLSTLVAMMAIPLLYRSRKYRMLVVESASYYSSVKLLAAKLAGIGAGDILLLAGMVLTALLRTSLQAGPLAFCLLLPFLVMSAAYLYMMGHFSSNGFFLGSIALGTAIILLAIGLPGRYLPMLRQGTGVGWGLFCGCLLAFCTGQLRYLLCRSPYAELQVI